MILEKSWPIRHHPMGAIFRALIAAKDSSFLGSISSPISKRLKCAKIEASLAAIMVGKAGRLERRRVGLYFHRIPLKSRTIHSLGINGAHLMGPNRG